MLISNKDLKKRVWDFFRGWGRIVDFDNMDKGLPAAVEFENSSKWIYYTRTGKETGCDKQTLFWDEIKIEEPKKPTNIIKNGCTIYGDISFSPGDFIYLHMKEGVIVGISKNPDPMDFNIEVCRIGYIDNNTSIFFNPDFV